METKTAEMQQVMDRLERVERQNRWLVRGGMALVLTCGSVLLMAQKPLARSVEAEKFILKDAAGKVRAELHMTESGPELALYGAQGTTVALLAARANGPFLDLFGPDTVASLSVNKDGPLLALTRGTGKGDASLSVYDVGPSLDLQDLEGFQTTVGNASLETPATGVKHQTSAASIHLFDPKGKILWSAP